MFLVQAWSHVCVKFMTVTFHDFCCEVIFLP